MVTALVDESKVPLTVYPSESSIVCVGDNEVSTLAQLPVFESQKLKVGLEQAP